MNIFKNFFFKSTPHYGLGSIESPKDVRNISLASFQKEVGLPNEYKTELPPVENQGLKGKCVGSAIHKITELKYNGVNLSDDDLYEQCKKIDGIPYIDGTYPSIGAYVAVKNGIATVEAYNTGDEAIKNKSRELYKLDGYAFVDTDFISICQAIFQNQAIICSFSIDSNWFKGKITKVMKSLGRHCVILNGFNIEKNTLYGQNSWGVTWIGYIMGVINPKLKGGTFEVFWKDYYDNISDIISFTYIPKEILEEVQSKEYRFTKILKYGDSGFDVKKLQERLTKEGFLLGVVDNIFGKQTKNAVMVYQQTKGITSDGIVGNITINELNKKSMSLIQKWAEAIKQYEGWYEGSRSFRNNNPGNLRSSYLAKSKDSGGYCVFDSYENGWKGLIYQLEIATNGKSRVYKPTMTLLEFFKVYAPSSDNNHPEKYAEYVAKKLGVTTNSVINSLI